MHFSGSIVNSYARSASKNRKNHSMKPIGKHEFNCRELRNLHFNELFSLARGNDPLLNNVDTFFTSRKRFLTAILSQLLSCSEVNDSRSPRKQTSAPSLLKEAFFRNSYSNPMSGSKEQCSRGTPMSSVSRRLRGSFARADMKARRRTPKLSPRFEKLTSALIMNGLRKNNYRTYRRSKLHDVANDHLVIWPGITHPSAPGNKNIV